MSSPKESSSILSSSALPIVCKVVQLCLSIFVIGLIVDPINNGILNRDQNHSGIVYVSWAGYIIINTIILIGYLIGDQIPKRTLMLFSLVGGILYFAAASVVIHDWRKNQVNVYYMPPPSKQYQDMAIASAVFGIFTGLTMFFETGIIAVYGEDFEE